LRYRPDVNDATDPTRGSTFVETAFLTPQIQAELPGLTEGEIIVIRSTRRKRNIAAYRQGGRIVVSIPARLSKADERSVVPEMVAKIRAQEARSADHSVLAGRVNTLLTNLVPEMSERPMWVNWRKMHERWGSCTSVDGTVRISDRLQRAPQNVLDFVLFHEAIHLRYGDHGREFQALLARFPERERAQAYLDGYEAAEDALRPPNLPL
jgi:predicted metal-dependent hydrolase